MICNVVSVPLVSANLRPEEAYVQILDSLQFLEKVCDDVFSRIDSKNAEQQKRIKAVNERLKVAESKVEVLRGSKKAIRVYASPTFPDNGKPDEYKSIFLGSGSGAQDIVRSSVPVKARFPRETRSLRKLELAPLVMTIRDPGLIFDENIQQGLGRPPGNLQSVSSLLLFNTDQNPYSKTGSSLLHEGSSKSRKLPEPEPQTPALDAAPPSFNQMDGRRPKDDLAYIPGFGDVPEFDLPNILPDLQGIVEDFGYEDLDMNFGGALPSLGGFTLDPPEVLAPLPLPTIASVPVPVPVAPPVTIQLPAIPGVQPPPPPPPPVEAPSPPKPPPPPPGQMPPPPPPMSPSRPPEVAAGPSAKASPADGRASLLESIRNAGGAGKAGLKGIKERKMEQKKKKQEEKATESAGGGDLMGDLKKRLTNMRKGISEGKKGTEAGPVQPASASFGSAMDQVNKLIPHAHTPIVPPKVNDNDDWND